MTDVANPQEAIPPTSPAADRPRGWWAALHVFWQSFYWGLLRNESFAHSSNFAYSILFSLFPFLILLTGLAAYWGGSDLAAAATDGLFLVLPEEIARIIKPELRTVLSGSQAQVLTVGVILLIIIVTSLIESLRMGLNYAYRTMDTRNFLIRRLEGTLFLLVGGIIILGLGFLVIVMPIAWRLAVPIVPELADYWTYFNRLPLVFFTAALFFFLLAAHFWLPAKRQTIMGVLPGVLTTMFLWFLAGLIFSYYMSHFSGYTRTYAGFAGVIAALLFFYIAGLIFQFGAEVNHALDDWKNGRTGMTAALYAETHKK
jgi:membrane protein